MASVVVHTEYANTRPVLALARELNHVFLNLLDNAVRAGASNIWVRTADSDKAVQVTISDDGPGVPAQVATLIFEPFFTTRPVGEGTGLGLYLSRRIIEGCGGGLRYVPREGGGSVFQVDIPSVEARA